MEDFRRRKRSLNEHYPQTISRSKSMRLDDDNLPVSLLLENLYIYDETQPQHDCRPIVKERKRKIPDDFSYAKRALKILRTENLSQRVQERSFMQQHKPAGSYNNKDKGKAKAKAKGKEKCTKRQRNDDQVLSETKISRVYHSDPPLSEPHYIWKLRDMRSLRQKGRHFLIPNKEVAFGMYQFIRSPVNCASDSHMIAFISILNCMCRPTSSSKANHDVIKDELHQVLNYKLDVFNTECYPFWGGLAALIRKLPSKMFQVDPFHFLTEVINIMSTLLDMDDNILQFLPLDDLQGTVKQLNDSETRYTSLLEQSNKLLLRRDSLREKEHNTNPSDQFKNPAYVILPTSLELQCGTLPDHFEIYKGHKKSFSSNQEYLQMHYDLLREDFIHPLRKAFHKIQDDSDDCKDLKIYENVRLVGKDIFRGNLSLKFKFCLPGRRRTNWEHNKRLIYGSLVCLSQDNFTTTIIFATVPERNVDELREGVATLTILEDVNTGSHATHIYPDEIYTMIESPGFLEAYAPVVSRLKTMMKNPEDLPLEEYLVHGSTEMYPPSYLEDNVLDLSGVQWRI